MNPEGRAGAGFNITRGMRREVERGHVPLGRTVGIFDTEIHVATFGLERALQLASQSPLANIFVVLDKEEAALRLHT